MNQTLIPWVREEKGTLTPLERANSFWHSTEQSDVNGPEVALRTSWGSFEIGHHTVRGWIYVPKAEFMALMDSLRSELSPESGVAGQKEVEEKPADTKRPRLETWLEKRAATWTKKKEKDKSTPRPGKAVLLEEAIADPQFVNDDITDWTFEMAWRAVKKRKKIPEEWSKGGLPGKLSQTVNNIEVMKN